MSEPGHPTNTDARFNRVLAEFIRRRDQGQAVDVESMCQGYPDLADALRSYAAGEERLLEMAGDAPVETPLDSAETIRPGAAQRTELPENTMFGRYRILRMLGEGAMGTVLLVEDTKLRREVALKIPKINGLEEPEFRNRFAREARAAAQLDHPNICRVYDADQHEGTPFFTMTYIDGLPLSRMIGTREIKDQRRVAEIIRGIASGLAHAHDKGTLHRDLKPGNVLMRSDGVPCVTDFGLARRVSAAEESRITQEGTVLGTPAYMSPEQIEGKPDRIGTASDIYSLGVVMYELLTGQLPFQGSVMAILGKALRDRVPRLSKLRSDVDSRLETLCLQMLEKTPAKRPESMSAIVKQLDEWLTKGTVSPTPAEAPVPQTDERLEALKATIISLVQRGQFAVAISKLELMVKLTTPASAAYVAWAKLKIPEVKALPKQLTASVPTLVATAQQCVEKHDYAQAAQLLQAIPEDFRSPECHDLLHQAVELQDECDLLLSDIRECVRKRQFTGIEGNLKRLLKLKPGHTFAQNLLSSLSTYRKTPSGERRYRYDEKGNLLPQGGDGFLGSWVRQALLVGVLAFLIASYFVRDYLRNSTVGDPQGLGLNGQNGGGEPGPEPVPVPPAPPVVPPLPDDPPENLIGSKAGDVREITLPGGVKLKQVWCPPGTFTMGTPGATISESPVQVTLTKGYWLAATETTQGQYTAVMGTTPWVGHGDTDYYKAGANFPASYIDHTEAEAYCAKLTEIERKAGRLPTGWKYALPTEAQWEYACRAGTKTAYSFGDDVSQMGDYAWFRENAYAIGEMYAHTVGTKKPNPWGLSDMHGNVWEWCRDAYEAKLPGGLDPLVVSADGAARRVDRGGSWSNTSGSCRSANRPMDLPTFRNLYLGFRPATILQAEIGDRVALDADSTPKNGPAPVVQPSPIPNVVTATPVIPHFVTDPMKNGLLAEFFTGENFDRKMNDRIESQINTKLWKKGWADGMVRQGKFSVRWTGSIKAPLSGNYELIAESDDGARVWIDGILVIDDWVSHGQRKKVGMFRFDNKPHTIKVEFWEAYVGSYFMQLSWRKRNDTSYVIPASAFFQPPNRSP